MKSTRLSINRINRFVVCVVIGLITSVGIAWLTFVNVDVSSHWNTVSRYFVTHGNHTWEYVHLHGIYYRAIFSKTFEGTYTPAEESVKDGPHWSRVRYYPNSIDAHSNGVMLEEAWGWPMVCVISRWRGNLQMTSWENISGIQVETRASLTKPNLLPIQPIWSGLFMNTTLYAFVVWIAFVLLTQLRKSIRIKRGLCIYCRYKIRGLTTCPECGNEVSRMNGL